MARKSKRALTIAAIMAVLVCSAAVGGWFLAGWITPDEDFRLDSVRSHIKAPSFELTDGNGVQRSLADFHDRIVVIFFGFTRCPEACPSELFKLAQVMKRLGPASRRVQVLLITLDPERDTPYLMKNYVAAFDPSFIGLTGTPAQIQRVTDAYRVFHTKRPVGSDYTIFHTTLTYVIDGRGRQRLMGKMTDSVDDFVHDLQELATEG